MGSLTITSGIYRGRKISTPENPGTRPLLSRLRKSMADILRPGISGARVLDLFSGSGAIAFELLSNGAGSAVAIEINPVAAKLIFENAEKLRAGETIEIINADFLHAISVLDKRIDSFDIIIVAPPYDIGLQQKAMDALVNSNIIKATTLIIVQRDSREPAVELSGRLCFMRTHSYGRTVFDFYKPVDSSIDTNIV